MQYNLSQGSLDGYSRAFYCEGNIISLQVNSVSNPTMTYKLQGALNGTWLDIDDDFGYIFGQANDMPHLYDTTRYDSLRVWLESWTDANIYIKYIIGSCACSSDVVQLDLRLDHAEEEIENVSDALDQVIKDLDGYYYFERIVEQGSQIQDLRNAADGYIRADGTKELTADWDAGSFSIHADNLDAKNEGMLSEPNIGDNGDLTISVSSAEVLARTTSDWNGHLERYTVPEATALSVTNNALNWIVVDNNTTPGSPVYAALLSNEIINNSTILPVARVYIDDGAIEYKNTYGSVGRSAAIRNFDRVMRVRGIERESGFAVSETATRVVNVADGVVWFGVNRTTLGAIAQGGSGVTSQLWYHSSGNWTHSDITTYNNTQYDNGTDLVTLTANRYAVNWIFRNIVSSEIDIVLGTGDYTISQAEAAMVPSLPGAISGFYVLVGKIIVQKSASTATLIQSVVNTAFTSSAITDHGSLSGLTDNDHPQYAFPLNSADGYVCFFADGNNYIAGDNDLYWNRALNRLETNQITNASKYLELGTAVTSNTYNFGAGDVIVGGRFQVIGETRFGNSFIMGSTAGMFFGSWSGNALQFNGNTANAESLMSVGPTVGRQINFTNENSYSKDHDHDTQTNPTFYCHSVTNVDSDNTQWFSFCHDCTNAYFATGSGGFIFDPASGAVDIDGYIYDNGNALRLGSNQTTSHSLTTGDVILNNLEINGTTYFDGSPVCFSSMYVTSGYSIFLGDWATDVMGFQGRVDFEQGVVSVGPRAGYQWCLTTDTNRTKDHDHDRQTNPTFYIHSATDPDSNNTQWLSFAHDQTNAQIKTDAGGIYLDPESGAVEIDGYLAADSVTAYDFIKLAPTTEPGSPEEGMVYYNASEHKLKVYNGSTWVDLH